MIITIHENQNIKINTVKLPHVGIQNHNLITVVRVPHIRMIIITITKYYYKFQKITIIISQVVKY